MSDYVHELFCTIILLLENTFLHFKPLFFHSRFSHRIKFYIKINLVVKLLIKSVPLLKQLLLTDALKLGFHL